MADSDDATALPAARRDVEAWIEGLVDLLDMTDEDPDLEEPGDVEPSLGWPENARWSLGGTLDLEDEHDGCEPDVDGGPSLSWPDGRIDQTASPGGIRDLEWECEDEGAQCEDEVFEHADAVADQIAATPATTPAGAAAKLRLALAIGRGSELGEEGLASFEPVLRDREAMGFARS